MAACVSGKWAEYPWIRMNSFYATLRFSLTKWATLSG